MPQIRDLSELHPIVKPRVEAFLAECAQRGYVVLVTETRREKDTADAYYAQGRKDVNAVNALRSAALLPSISVAENSRTITKATWGRSWHHYGCAIDFVPMLAGKKPDWNYDPNDPLDLWDEIAAVAQTLGFKWGKSFGDLPHLDFHPGYSSLAKAYEWMKAHNDWRIPLSTD
jgi:peptidoglycan LD-endopeptidase CwlK